MATAEKENIVAEARKDMPPKMVPHHICAPLICVLLAACSGHNGEGDLAIDKLPKSQIQATNYLPLNPDKPGMQVNVQRYLVPGKYNIVGYFSPYDGISINMGQQLVQLSQMRNDIAVRTVNVNRLGVQGIDWQSPIMQEARIQKLPYFEIYDPAQNLRARGRPAYEQVKQWIQSMSYQH
jgi:hypothetical protein